MKREELLKNTGYWISKIQLDLYDQLEKYMSENKMNRTQLANKLGVTKGYITQILNGDFNHRISKLVELSLAIDKIPEINYIDLNQVIKEEKEDNKTVPFQLIEKPLISRGQSEPKGIICRISSTGTDYEIIETEDQSIQKEKIFVCGFR